MNSQKITLEVVSLVSIRQLQVFEGGRWQRKIGAIYFHRLENGHFVFHIVSDKTNGDWLLDEFKKGNLYVPTEEIRPEMS